MMGLKLRIADLRTALWHLRHGGIEQLRRWRRRRVASRSVPRLSRILDERFVMDVAPARAVPPRRPKVACILDEFSMRAWGEVFDLLPVTPADWKDQLSAHTPDLLFVESAWHGNEDSWQFHLTGSKAPSEPLQQLVAQCRKQGVPSVFWNKEDPPHFEDFLETAGLFDYVFTTDVNKVEAYRAALGHDHIDVLPFAAAEQIHNPARLRHGHQVRDVAFAGTYFAHKFPERRAQMELLLGGALDTAERLAHGLDIYSRFEGADTRYQFPSPFAERVVGSLDYDDMLLAYKAYKVFLNVNSVTDSPSMCARRVFEIVASGTPVLSADSAAIGNFFEPDEVPVAHHRGEAAQMIRALCRSSELRDRLVHKAQRRIWEHHTYAHRADALMQTVGLGPLDRLDVPSVSVLISTNRPNMVEHVLRSAGSQVGVDLQVVLVTHGFVISDAELHALASSAGVERLVHTTVASAEPLGACLQTAVGMAEGDILSKMDDDDYYAPNYLKDLVNSMRFSTADIVGKQAHYMHIASSDATMLRFPEREHRWTDIVMGPTVTARREVFQEVGFARLPTGEDTDFLRRAAEGGARIYSADRFNFIQRRSSGHTWDASDWELLATGDVRAFGALQTHVTV